MKRSVSPELLVLTALSALTHCWRLFTPNAVVFDEAHFKHHAGHYLDGTYYFDVHPPLAKLLYALEARVAGLSAATLLGPEPAVALRVLPALLGTLIVPLGYLIVRQLGGARRVAALAAFALLCENGLLVDSRFALIEPLLIPFGLGAITLYLAARTRRGVMRWFLVAMSAFLAGCALSAKWTGASALGLVLAAWFFEEPRPWSPGGWGLALRRKLGEGAVLTGIPVIVYVVTFAIHFALLTRTGTDNTYMSPRFQATLVGSPRYDPAARMSLLAKLRDVHHAMAAGNRALEYVTNPASSPWYTWPIMKHPIGLWENEVLDAGRKQSIALVGNPVLWWGALLIIGIAAIRFFRRRDLARRHGFALAFLGMGCAINFLPFIAIRRVMYLYHYLFALVFVILLGAYSMGILAGWNDGADVGLWSFSSRRAATSYWIVGAVILAGFLYFAPLTYGWTLSQASYDARMWVLHPRLE